MHSILALEGIQENSESHVLYIIDKSIMLSDKLTRFFIRKKFIRKWGSNGQNRKKILRKSRSSISKI